jgi:galactitol-specific phosphotransferase system IIB component
MELMNIEKAKENVELAAQLQKNKTILEYNQFQKDSINKKQQDSAIIIQTEKLNNSLKSQEVKNSELFFIVFLIFGFL